MTLLGSTRLQPDLYGRFGVKRIEVGLSFGPECYIIPRVRLPCRLVGLT